MSDLLTAPRGELIKLVYELVEENQTLKTRLAELQAKLRKLQEEKTDKRDKTPSFVRANVKRKKRKRTRKKRARGYVRKSETPTKQIFHSYEICPDCHQALGKPHLAHKRQIIDIPLCVPAEIIEHVIFKRWCYQCKKRVAPKVDLSSMTLGKHRVGLNLMATIGTLRERCRLPIGAIGYYLSTFHGLHLSKGEIVEILHKIASVYQKDYEDLKTKILSSPAICADETGHREDGINGYLWNFVIPECQLLLYRKSRSKKVVREVIGEDGKDFDGVIVSDFYAAYNEHAGFQQRCWAHLLKDVRELKKEHSRHPPLNLWAKRIKDLYQTAKAYPGPDPDLPLGIQAQERIKKEAEFKQALREICTPCLNKDSPMSPLSGRMIRFLSELFIFIRFPNVPSTNNLAERTLRHAVVQRKISGGTRSEKGSQTKAILGSLFGTWNLKDLNPLEECRLLLARAPCQ